VTTDPDPTPTTTPWQEYQAAAQNLDAVRREAAATAAADTAAVTAARAELAALRERLGVQQARIFDAADRAGLPRPEVTPSPEEVTAVGAALAAGPAAALEALQNGRHQLDLADAELAGQGVGSGRPAGGVGLRNLLVYAPLAVVALLLQLGLMFLLAPASAVWWLVLAAVLPVLAFGLGFAGVGLVFDPGPDGRVPRTPLLGALVCFATTPLLCVGYAALRLL
jgi:hypothetical protein